MLGEFAAAVRSGRVTAVDLVQRSLDLIEVHNPLLNAVTDVRPEALDEAKRIDERVARGEDPGLLAGLPVLVKDMEDVAGMRTTYGSRLFQNTPAATKDSLIPRRLRAAGGVVVGKTNVPEFASEGYTDNRVFGPSRNPWGADWSPGGSSGGSGAALAAGLAPIATGSDGGGSIRIPAAVCGLVGLKPSHGLVGRDPIPEWIDLSEQGPMACSIVDLKLLLQVMAGPVPGDPTALPYRPAWRDELPERILAAPRFCDWGPLPSEIQTLFDRALASIEFDLGLPVDTIEPSSIFRAGVPDRDWMSIGGVEHLYHVGPGWVDSNWDDFDPAFQRFMATAREIPLEEYLAARRRRFEYVKELDLLLGEHAVLVVPTLGRDGWLAEGTVPETGEPPDYDAYNTYVPNLCGHPALSIPAGTCTNGLPFGLTLTGPRFRDDMLLTLGEAWERVHPWPVVASGYAPFRSEP